MVRERVLWHGLTLAETILRHGGARGTVERLLAAAVGANAGIGLAAVLGRR